MKLVIIYVYPDLNPHIYKALARRFVDTYMEYPPGGTDHEIIVAVNSGRSDNPEYARLMSPLACQFMMHNNEGKDIGAYQLAARQLDCDLMICLGAPVHFHRAGWLDRIANAYEQNGPGLYGAWAFYEPSHHIRTTAFWLPPELLRSYPYVIQNDTRYEFEHGKRNIHAYAKSKGMESFMLTWQGCFTPPQWQHVTREDSLLLDQHTEKHHLQ